MRGFLIAGFVSMFMLSCAEEKCREMYKEDCGCEDAYIPVCGCNDKTYANKCYAECAGIEYVEGKCPQ